MVRTITNAVLAILQVAFAATLAVVWWNIYTNWPSSAMLVMGIPGLSFLLAFVSVVGIVLNVGRAKGMFTASVVSLVLSVAAVVAAFGVGG